MSISRFPYSQVEWVLKDAIVSNPPDISANGKSDEYQFLHVCGKN